MDDNQNITEGEDVAFDALGDLTIDSYLEKLKKTRA